MVPQPQEVSVHFVCISSIQPTSILITNHKVLYPIFTQISLLQILMCLLCMALTPAL